MAVATDAIDSFLDQTSAPPDIPPLLQRPDDQADLPVADDATAQEALKNLALTKQAVGIATAPLDADWAHTNIDPIAPEPPPDTSEIDKFLDDSEPAETTDEARKTLADPNISHYLDWDARVALSHLARGQEAGSNLADAAKAIGGWWMHAQYPSYWGEVGRELTNKFINPAAKTATAAIENAGRLGRGPNEPPQDGEQMALGAGKEALNVGSGVGDFLMRAPGTLTDLIGGIANVADPRDSDNVDAVRSIINDAAQYGVNAKNELVKMTGGEPESPESKVAEFAPWLVVPGGAEEAASPLIAKGVNAAVEGALPAIGKGIEMGAKGVKAGIVPAAIAADLYASGGSITGMASAFMTLLTKYGGENIPVLGKIKHFALEAPFDALAKGGNILSKTGDGVTVFDAMGDALDQEISRQAQRLEIMKAKNPAAAEEAFTDDTVNGGRLNKSKELSGPAKEMRQVEEKIASNASRKAFVDKYKNVWNIFSSLTKYGIKTAAQADLGAATSGAVMAGLSGTSAPPGQEVPAATEGFKLGAALGGPGAALGAPEAVDQAEHGRSGKILSGAARAVLEGHPYGRTDAVTSLSGDMQDVVRKYQGLADLSGSKPLLVLKPDDLKKAMKEVEGRDVAEAPNGFVGKNVIYANADTLASGNIPHEMMHGTGIDSNPDVVQAVRGMVTDHPDKVQKGLDKYNADLLHTSPSATPLTLDSSPKEIIAALGADILRDIPPEALFGGRSGGQLLSKWFDDKFGSNGIGYTSQYGFPVTPEVKSAVTNALFDIGKKAARGPKPVSPAIPSVASPAAASIPSVPVVAPNVIQTAAGAIQAMGYKAKEALEMARSAAAEGLDTPEKIVARALEKKAPGNAIPIGGENEPKKSIPEVSMAEPTGGGVAGVVPEAKPPTAIPSVEKGQQADVVEHPDYEAIAEKARAQRTAELANTKRKTKDAEIERAGLEAAAQAHAEHLKAQGQFMPANRGKEERRDGAPRVMAELENEGAIEHGTDIPVSTAAYFSIGHEAPGSKVWIYDESSGAVKAVSGGSHGMAFGHDVADRSFKGWYDPDRNVISVAFPERERRKLGDREPTVDDIPAKVYNKLQSKFGKEADMMAFMPAAVEKPATEKKRGDLVSWRTDRFGDSSISGNRLDPNDPFHRLLINKAGLSPEHTDRLLKFSDNMGKLIGLENYAHAAKEGEATGVTRKEEQKASPAQARVEKAGETQNAPLNIIPSFIKFNLPSNRFTLHGFNPDKFFANGAKLFSYPESGALKAYPGGVNDPQIVKDFKAARENNDNGWTGDGRKPIEGTPFTQARQTKGFEPNIIPHDRFQVLNAMMGQEAPKGRTPKSADVQILGQRNAAYTDPESGEFNQVRAKLGPETGLLENTSESLRPENMSGAIRSEPVADAHLLRPSGVKPEQLKALAETKPLRTDFSAGGFMPATKGISNRLREEPERAKDFHGGIPEIHGPEGSGGKFPEVAPEETDLQGRSTKEAARDYAAQYDQAQQNRRSLGDFLRTELDKVSSNLSLTDKARSFAKEELQGYIDDLETTGKLPRNVRQPIYRADYDRKQYTDYATGGVAALDAVEKGLTKLGLKRDAFNPPTPPRADIVPRNYDPGQAFMPASRDEEPSDVGRRAFAKGIPAVEQRGFKALRLGIPEVQKEEPIGVTETLAELNRRNGRAAEVPTPENKGLGQGEFQMMPKGRPKPGPNADSEPWVHRYFELLKKEYPDGGLAPTGKLSDKEELEMDKLHQQAVKEFGSYDAFMKAHGQKSYGSFDEFHQANSNTHPRVRSTAAASRIAPSPHRIPATP